MMVACKNNYGVQSRFLAECNAAIEVLLEELNDRPVQKLSGSRRTLFEQFDRPAMETKMFCAFPHVLKPFCLE